MIEVDLRPEGGRPAGPSRSTRSLDAVRRRLEPLAASARDAAVPAAALLLAAVLAASWIGLEGRARDLDARLARAAADSGRAAEARAARDTLLARAEALRRRLEVVREHDRGRAAWPLLLVELARALPDDAWLRAVERLSPHPRLRVRLHASALRSGAVTRLVRDLRASAAVGAVELEGSSSRRAAGSGSQRFSVVVTAAGPGPGPRAARPSADPGGD